MCFQNQLKSLKRLAAIGDYSGAPALLRNEDVSSAANRGKGFVLIFIIFRVF